MPSNIIKKIIELLPLLLTLGLYAFLSIFFNKITVENRNIVKNMVQIQNNLSVECNPVQVTTCNFNLNDKKPKVQVEKIDSKKEVQILGFRVKNFVLQIIASSVLGLNIVITILLIILLLQQKQTSSNLSKFIENSVHQYDSTIV